MTAEPAQARASREPGSLAEAASAPGTLGMDSSPPLTGPYTEHDPCHDPLVMFAHLAGTTERIRFATGVLVLPQRQTALVARQAADVDLLSISRLGSTAGSSSAA